MPKTGEVEEPFEHLRALQPSSKHSNEAKRQSIQERDRHLGHAWVEVEGAHIKYDDGGAPCVVEEYCLSYIPHLVIEFPALFKADHAQVDDKYDGIAQPSVSDALRNSICVEVSHCP